MRQDHPAPVHCGQAADRLRLHPGVWWSAWHQGEWGARAQGGIHASGENMNDIGDLWGDMGGDYIHEVTVFLNQHSLYDWFQELALYGEFTIRETLQYFGR